MNKPYYDRWDGIDRFPVKKAMYLCADIEPPEVGLVVSAELIEMVARIKKEVPCQEVATEWGGKWDKTLYVKRSDLREWAERTGQRAAMPFLFPEDRGGSARPAQGLPRIEARHNDVVVTIAHREAIPLRALPYVSPGLSPARIARGLAVGGGLLSVGDDRPFLSRTKAYFLENGKPTEMPCHSWHRYACALDEREKSIPHLDPEYRDEIKMLPAGVFVWKLDFEIDYGGWVPHAPGEPENQMERVAWYEPLIPADIRKTIMEGFERYAVAFEEGAMMSTAMANAGDTAQINDESADNRSPDSREAGASRTAYRVIRALALALADAYPEKLKKDGAPFVGYDKPTGNAGIVGHLIGGNHTDLKTTALEKYIGQALKGN